MTWIAEVIVRAGANFGLAVAALSAVVYGGISVLLARRWDKGGER